MNYLYVQLVLGLWIMVSPWILGFGGSALITWSNAVAGLVVFLSSLWAIFGEIKIGKDGKEEKH